MSILISQVNHNTPIQVRRYTTRAYSGSGLRMPNCCAYAIGRLSYLYSNQNAEVLGIWDGTQYIKYCDFPSILSSIQSGNAGAWGHNALKLDEAHCSNTATLGGLISWSKGKADSSNGHVAVIEAVSPDGKEIVISESWYSQHDSTDDAKFMHTQVLRWNGEGWFASAPQYFPSQYARDNWLGSNSGYYYTTIYNPYPNLYTGYNLSGNVDPFEPIPVDPQKLHHQMNSSITLQSFLTLLNIKEYNDRGRAKNLIIRRR